MAIKVIRKDANGRVFVDVDNMPGARYSGSRLYLDPDLAGGGFTLANNKGYLKTDLWYQKDIYNISGLLNVIKNNKYSIKSTISRTQSLSYKKGVSKKITLLGPNQLSLKKLFFKKINRASFSTLSYKKNPIKIFNRANSGSFSLKKNLIKSNINIFTSQTLHPDGKMILKPISFISTNNFSINKKYFLKILLSSSSFIDTIYSGGLRLFFGISTPSRLRTSKALRKKVKFNSNSLNFLKKLLNKNVKYKNSSGLIFKIGSRIIMTFDYKSSSNVSLRKNIGKVIKHSSVSILKNTLLEIKKRGKRYLKKIGV